jgi:hypothetical protein
MPLLIRRRPLLRAAAIGGGAYFAGKRRMDLSEQLAQLGRLRQQGVLTDAEVAQERANLLGS